MTLNRSSGMTPEIDVAAGDVATGAFSGSPLGSARLKERNSDFVVDELLPFEPRGEGGHQLLCVRQDGWNSASVARWLAGALGCPVREIGYCGHKDRHAVTTQYFSAPASSVPEDALTGLDWPQGLSLVSAARHDKKLKRGVHLGNRFKIRLRQVDAAEDAVGQRLTCIARYGFPNSFGSQRFGREGGNVERARRLLSSRSFRRSRNAAQSIEVSSLRSMLFNQVLAARVGNASWLEPMEDDLMILDGTRSFFAAPPRDARHDDLDARVLAGDLHVSGPLWGLPGARLPQGLLARERELLSEFASDLELLEKRRFGMERRPLRALAKDLSWNWTDKGVLELDFSLGRGSYATALLSLLFDLDDRVANGAAAR
ncbi:MAG: tRNA pseudouridine(13) synthase TruD [Proteobacteria bacterium]|nr:MAG: tRNA pseudouridine(13) synthase TruD [Pseudomonadota bacterium]